MKHLLLQSGLLAAFLFGASTVGAQDNTRIVFETYCWDNSADGDTFVCEDGGREWGRATNIPHPPLEEEQPVTQNYTTKHSVTQADHDNCFATANADPKYTDIIVDSWVSCGVNADWFAYPFAKGEISVGFGDELEKGILKDSNREGGDPTMQWMNVVAEVKSIACNCVIVIPRGPM